MASSTLGRWPLLGGRRFAHAAIPRPGVGHDGRGVARAVGDYLFGLDDQPEPAALATSRIPDAATGFRWRLTWRTDVLVAYDGTEQRIATLTNPRQRFEGSFLLDDADTRTIRQLLSASADGTYDLPLAHEAVAAIVELSGGTIYISADAASKADWIESGRRIYVRGPSGSAYTTTITGSSGGTINVASSPPTGGHFPAHLTLVFPCETVRFEDGQTIGRYPVNASRWNFTARAGARSLGGAGAPALATFDGYTVLDRRPFQEKETPEVFGAGVEFLDNEASMTSATSWARAKLRRLGTWRIDSPSDRQWWKAFLAERRGRYQPFLFPTWRPDLVLAEQPTAGAYSIRVTTPYIAEWWPSLAHRRLQIEYADRSVTYHAIHSVTEASDYQEILLWMPLPSTIPSGGVAKVSFLETARLDTDDVAIEYGSGWKAKVSPPSIVVQEDQESPNLWPKNYENVDKVEDALGLTLSELYSFNEASGNVVGLKNGTVLTAAGAPTYARTTGPHRGINYGAAGARHSADVHGLGTGSGWYATVFEPVSGAGTLLSRCIGRDNAGFTDALTAYLQTTGTPTCAIRDTGSNAILLADTVTNIRALGGLWLVQIQIDRMNHRAVNRWSRLGGISLEFAGSILGFGSLSGVGATFGFGSLGALNHGNANYAAYVASGTQCEGLSFCASMARLLGFE